jgi:hypothetical protein
MIQIYMMKVDNIYSNNFLNLKKKIFIYFNKIFI